MKTTYSVYETNGGSLHLFAYDGGELKFSLKDWEPAPVLNAVFDLQNGHTAEQLNSIATWPLDTEDLENEENTAAVYEQNPAAAKRIADNNGLYFERAGRAGEQFLHALQWYTDAESFFDAVDLYEATARAVKDIASTLELTSRDVMTLFEHATKNACRIACETDDSDDLAYTADCIGECGKALGLLRNCQCDHFRTEAGEIKYCTAEEAEERQLSFEFRSSDLKKNEQIEGIISTYWPHDRHTEHSPTIYDRDRENVWKTWKYTR